MCSLTLSEPVSGSGSRKGWDFCIPQTEHLDLSSAGVWWGSQLCDPLYWWWILQHWAPNRSAFTPRNIKYLPWYLALLLSFFHRQITRKTQMSGERSYSPSVKKILYSSRVREREGKQIAGKAVGLYLANSQLRKEKADLLKINLLRWNEIFKYELHSKESTYREFKHNNCFLLHRGFIFSFIKNGKHDLSR